MAPGATTPFNTTGEARTVWGERPVVRIHCAHGEPAHIFFASDLGTFPLETPAPRLDNVQILQLNPVDRQRWHVGSINPGASPLVLRQPWSERRVPVGSRREFTYQDRHTAFAAIRATGSRPRRPSVTPGTSTLTTSCSGISRGPAGRGRMTASSNSGGPTASLFPITSATPVWAIGAPPRGEWLAVSTGSWLCRGFGPRNIWIHRWRATNNDSNGGVGGRLTVTFEPSATTTSISPL